MRSLRMSPEVFAVFTRGRDRQVWYPCGSLKGDSRSKSLVEAWRDNSLFLKVLGYLARKKHLPVGNYGSPMPMDLLGS